MKLRFSIRDLLWLTVLTGVLVAWWIDRSQLAEQLDKFGVEFRTGPPDPGDFKRLDP